LRIRYWVETVLEAKVRIRFTFSRGDAFRVIVCSRGALLSPMSCEVAHGAVAVSAVLSLPLAAAFSAVFVEISARR